MRSKRYFRRSSLGFGGRVKMVRELIRIAQSAQERMPQTPRCPGMLPARAGEISAGNALDGKHFRAFDEHERPCSCSNTFAALPGRR